MFPIMPGDVVRRTDRPARYVPLTGEVVAVGAMSTFWGRTDEAPIKPNHVIVRATFAGVTRHFGLSDLEVVR